MSNPLVYDCWCGERHRKDPLEPDEAIRNLWHLVIAELRIPQLYAWLRSLADRREATEANAIGDLLSRKATYCPYPNSLGGHTFETTPPQEAVCVQCGVVFVPSYVPDDNPQEES